MGHLNAIEIVDLVEGRLAPSRAAHAGACGECRAAAREAREALAGAASGPLPEPSPLFWEHLAARVKDAVDREPAPRAKRGWTLWGVPAWAWAGAAVLTIGIVSAALWRPSRTEVRPVTRASTEQPSSGMTEAAASLDIRNEDIESDQAWAIVLAVAEDVDWEDVTAAGIVVVRPQAAERVVSQLSGNERSELARLIQEELRRAGA